MDGNRAPPSTARSLRSEGDALSLSIAAASIIAKVTRDQIMRDLGARHPGYGWEHNAGYGTAEHHAAHRTPGHHPRASTLISTNF